MIWRARSSTIQEERESARIFKHGVNIGFAIFLRAFLIITVPAISALLIAGSEVFHGFMIKIRRMIGVTVVIVVIVLGPQLLIVL